MAIFTFSPGAQFDSLTKPEMAEVLAAQQDIQTRALLRGVGWFEQFYSIAAIGPSVNIFSTSGTVGPTLGRPFPPNGFVWAPMLVGWEVSGSTNIRIYKGAPPGLSSTPAGIGRALTSNTGTPLVASNQFAKGQVIQRNGEQLTLVCVTPADFLLSVYVTGIEVPAERIGELFL